jgi:hypothetical protein
MPLLGTVVELPKAKTGRPKKNAKPVKRKKLKGANNRKPGTRNAKLGPQSNE